MLSVLERPTKTVVGTMTAVSSLFALGALAAIIAWIYYVARAVNDDEIGGSDGAAGSPFGTAEVMFQGTVLAVLCYLVFRHHFHCHY